MKKTELQGIKYVLAFIALFIALAYAGTSDYNEQVILNMSQSDYDSIVTQYQENHHGNMPSDNEIVKIYDREYR